MPVLAKRYGRFTCQALVAGAGAALFASMASASPIVNFDIVVTGGTGSPNNVSFVQAGTPTVMPGVFNYQQTGSPFPTGIQGPNNEWDISVWNFNADGDPTGTGGSTGAKIGSAFTVTNNLPDVANAAANHLYFSIMVTMPVLASSGPTTFFGNGGFTLSSPGSQFGAPGQITAIGNPIWNFMINGGDVASLFPAGFNLGLSGAGTNSTSANLLAGQTGPLAGIHPTTMGIRLDFDLTAGETVTFNGVFGFVPTPGCLALLGLAGLTGRSRRRR